MEIKATDSLGSGVINAAYLKTFSKHIQNSTSNNMVAGCDFF